MLCVYSSLLSQKLSTAVATIKITGFLGVAQCSLVGVHLNMLPVSS